MTPASRALWLERAGRATYGIAIAVLVIEGVALRALGATADTRSGRASVLSGGLAFGGMALSNKLVFVAMMGWFYEHRVVDLGLGPLAWLAGFVVYDLVFYLAHRAGHEVRLLWCFHAVHHSSEEMRLTSAIRGSALDAIYLPWFFVWLPILGLHPALVLIVESFGRIWGVLVHVHPRFVGKLGWLDAAIVTPSFHRVHHGRDAAYLDRNYGEVLSVWDHLLGTWQREEHPPDYGLLKELDSGSLKEIQLSPWQDLWRDVRRAPDMTARLRYLFDAPGWSHDGPDQRVRARRDSRRGC